MSRNADCNNKGMDHPTAINWLLGDIPLPGRGKVWALTVGQ